MLENKGLEKKRLLIKEKMGLVYQNFGVPALLFFLQPSV